MNMNRFDIEKVGVPANGIVLERVCFGINGKEILKSLSLEVTASKVGIVGRNGSGKSTLARLLSGLIAPASGAVQVNGFDPFKDRKSALMQIGILFQNPDHQIIFPTVEEEIAFGLRQMGQSKDMADTNTRAILNVFGKDHWREASISTLSQGQKHLVCLMAVVAMKPKMIILDEPYSGLDIPTKAQLNRYLSRYEGMLVHISHHPNDLADYEQVIWLEEGAVMQEGPAQQVLMAYAAAMEEIGGRDDISDLAG